MLSSIVAGCRAIVRCTCAAFSLRFSSRVSAGGAVNLADTGGKVFTLVPSSATFRADRDRAGVPVHDEQGRSFSPHGARKWYSTTLTNAGVAPRMVDFLMRHTGGDAARYYQPTLEEQSAALQALPCLLTTATGLADEIGESSGRSVDKPSARTESIGVTPESPVLIAQDKSKNRLPASPGHRCDNCGSPRAGGSSSCFSEGSSEPSGSGREFAIRNRGYCVSSATTSLCDAAEALIRAVRKLLAGGSDDRAHDHAG